MAFLFVLCVIILAFSLSNVKFCTNCNQKRTIVHSSFLLSARELKVKVQRFVVVANWSNKKKLYHLWPMWATNRQACHCLVLLHTKTEVAKENVVAFNALNALSLQRHFPRLISLVQCAQFNKYFCCFSYWYWPAWQLVHFAIKHHA